MVATAETFPQPQKFPERPFLVRAVCGNVSAMAKHPISQRPGRTAAAAPLEVQHLDDGRTKQPKTAKRRKTAYANTAVRSPSEFGGPPIGEWILHFDKKQQEVADLVGKSKSWLSKKLSGQLRLFDEDVRLIADALGIDEIEIRMPPPKDTLFGMPEDDLFNTPPPGSGGVRSRAKPRPK